MSEIRAGKQFKAGAAAEPDARTSVLASIRHALSGTADDIGAAIPRQYRRSSALSRKEVLELMKARLRDYDAQVSECLRVGLSDTIATTLREQKLSRVVIPKGLPVSLLPDGFEFVMDDNLSHAALNDTDCILTQSTLAIAETGTIVLQNVPGQGRRAATLIPDHHLCLVNTDDVVATVPEAIERLQGTAQLATTFISGPSATADIEMTRIKGVHGPRFLNVILVES